MIRGRAAFALALVMMFAVLGSSTGLAQSAPIASATVTLTFPLDPDARDEVYPEHTDTVENLVEGCGSDHFTTEMVFRGFRFNEDQAEHGCGEARFQVDVPVGATGMDVVYRATRSLEQPASDLVVNVEVNVIQELRIYDAAEPDTYVQNQLDFPVDVPDASTGSEPRPVPVILPDADQVIVAWWFRDVGPTPSDQIPNSLRGQALTARVVEPSVRFHGVPAADTSLEQVRGAVDGDTVAIEQRMTASVPDDLPPGALASLHFRLPDSFSIGYLQAPDGRNIPLSQVEITEGAGTVGMNLDADLIDQYGDGAYTAVFVGSEALRASPVLAFGVLMLMILPVPAGVYATRGVGEFRRTAVGSYLDQVNIIRLIVGGVWAVYVALIAVVIGGRMWPLIVAWPIEIQAALLHIGFGVASAVFLFIGLFWRRRLMGVMEDDLEEKRRTNEELTRSNKELEQFAYVASHDLQEPLRTIGRFTQLVKHRYGKDMPEDANEFMDYAVDGAQRMQALVDDLLAYSRVGTRARDLEDVPLDSVADQVLAGLAAAIEDNKAAVTMDALPVVRGDRAQLAQVYQNLIANAMKFRSPRRRPKIHLGAEKDKEGQWVMSVQDNGIGIEPDQHERIFVIFQRLHAREEYEGTGIGLAVVKKIIERLGGRIWLESTPKKGTTFFFSLPPGNSEVAD